MSLEQELTSINESRLTSVIDNIWQQTVERPQPDETTLVYLEDKYPALTNMVDELTHRWHEDTEARGLDPELAVAMGLGARIAILSLMSYSEAESLREIFHTKPDSE